MPYIIVFDDDMGTCVPMGLDKDCDGAVCSIYEKTPVVAFHDKIDAHRAIRVSRKFAEMENEQGKPCNEDFLPENRKYIKILKVEYPINLPWKK